MVNFARQGEIIKSSVPADLALIKDFFRETVDYPELRNPHVEKLVSTNVRQESRDSAVLIPLIEDTHPRMLVTKRQANIRFAGHLCFPGGISDPGDVSAVDTALRETEEEVNLDVEDVEILGTLGDYYTQAGYRITPVVGVVQHPVKVDPNPREVESIHEISLAGVLNPDRYQLTWHGENRAHFSYSEKGIRIAGPTVSIMIGLLEALSGFRNTVPG